MTILEHKNFGTQERKTLEKQDLTMPGGRFPIRNKADLENAIQAYGRANDKPAVKAWIIKRAKALGLTDILPDKWMESDVKQSAFMDKFLSHYGVKGQKWGVRRSKRQLSKAAKASGRSVKDMSDEELRTAVNRMNMEQQYSRLSSGGSNRNRNLVAAGGAFAASIALNVVRQQVTNQANQRIASAIAARAARRAAGG